MICIKYYIININYSVLLNYHRGSWLIFDIMLSSQPQLIVVFSHRRCSSHALMLSHSQQKQQQRPLSCSLPRTLSLSLFSITLSSLHSPLTHSRLACSKCNKKLTKKFITSCWNSKTKLMPRETTKKSAYPKTCMTGYSIAWLLPE